MNLRHLEVLHAIMQTGSVTGAGQLLGISQPAVTKTLRRAEDELGFHLFDRVKGRLMPTKEADILYPSLHRLHDDLQSIDQTALDIRAGRTGHLSLTSIPTLGETVLPQAIACFLKDRPEVNLTFQVRPRRQIVDLVASHSVDLGFAFLAPAHANIENEVLCSGELVCIMPANHPLADKDVVRPADIANEKFVFFSRDQGLRPLIESVFTEARIDPPHNVEVGLISTAWALVAAGVGVSIVDDLSQMDRMHEGIVALPFRPQVLIAAEILAPRLLPRSQLAREFVQVLKSVIGHC